ncbi:hypothetical protein D3C81_2236960 [compost metagenome]
MHLEFHQLQKYANGVPILQHPYIIPFHYEEKEGTYNPQEVLDSSQPQNPLFLSRVLVLKMRMNS